MIEPCRAAVRPRVVSPETGDVVPLEDEVAVWLEGNSRTLRIVGGPGSGKTTAIRHLATIYGARNDVILVDDGGTAQENVVTDPRRLIYSASAEPPATLDATLRLASWNDDDLLEYCLARHRPRCSSIIGRIRAMCDARRLHGVPQLWTLVIDAFAADDTANDWRAVLEGELARTVSEVDAAIIRHWCLSELLGREKKATVSLRLLQKRRRHAKSIPWIRHRAAHAVLAAAHVLYLLGTERKPFFLEYIWPDDLRDETASLLAVAPAAQRRLNQIVIGKQERYQGTAATLLYAAEQGWQPPPGTQAKLSGAVFTGASWRGIDLSHARLQKVDFSGADLSGARLEQI
ncbi:MAG: pentapeptide repeat-containing protein, partial [Pirellulales bacterium]